MAFCSQEDEELNDETRQTEDKETNTECVFIPEQGKQRKLSAAGVAPGAVHDDKNSIVIKRSQTFSPSAAVSKNHYICRVSFSFYRMISRITWLSDDLSEKMNFFEL